MPLIISIDDGKVAAALAKLQASLDDLHPVMDAIGQELESRVARRFDTQTDPLGRPWEEWADSTVKSYPKGGNGRILDRFSDMLGSLNHQADAKVVRVGFGEPYAVYHEFESPKTNLPRRGLLTADPDSGTLSEQDLEAIFGLLAEFLTEI